MNAIAIKEEIDGYVKIIARCTKNLPANPVLEELRSLVFEFRDTMPVVMALRNKNLRPHHWVEIKECIGKPFDIDDEAFTL